MAVGILNGKSHLADKKGELYLLDEALFSTLQGLMVMVLTASNISGVPMVY